MSGVSAMSAKLQENHEEEDDIQCALPATAMGRIPLAGSAGSGPPGGGEEAKEEKHGSQVALPATGEGVPRKKSPKKLFCKDGVVYSVGDVVYVKQVDVCEVKESLWHRMNSRESHGSLAEKDADVSSLGVDDEGVNETMLSDVNMRESTVDLEKIEVETKETKNDVKDKNEVETKENENGVMEKNEVETKENENDVKEKNEVETKENENDVMEKNEVETKENENDVMEQDDLKECRKEKRRSVKFFDKDATAGKGPPCKILAKSCLDKGREVVVRYHGQVEREQSLWHQMHGYVDVQEVQVDMKCDEDCEGTVDCKIEVDEEEIAVDEDENLEPKEERVKECKRSVKGLDKDSIDRWTANLRNKSVVLRDHTYSTFNERDDGNQKENKIAPKRGRPSKSRGRGGARGGGRGGKIAGRESINLFSQTDLSTNIVLENELGVSSSNTDQQTCSRKRKKPKRYSAASSENVCFGKVQSPYTAYNFSTNSQMSSEDLSGQLGPIMFRVRETMEGLPVRISKKGLFDGVSELELICKDALINYNLEAVKVDKYVLVKKKTEGDSDGSDSDDDETDWVDVSSHTKPGTHNHHGRKLLKVKDDGNFYYVSLDNPGAVLEVHSKLSVFNSQSVPEWLLKPQGIVPQQPVVVVYPVVVPPVLLPAVQVPLAQQQVQQQLLQLPPGPVQGPDNHTYGPTPDTHTRHDSHPQRVNVAQQSIAAGPLTNREVRDIQRGPQGVLGTGYVNNTAWNKTVAKLKLPNILKDGDYQSLTSLSRENFYRFVGDFVIPALQATGRRPFSGTADSVAAIALHKLSKNPDMRSLGISGGVSASTVHDWFWVVWETFYENCNLLRMIRTLSQNNHLATILNEMSNATNRCPIFMAMYGHLPMLWAQGEAQRLGTVVGWLPGQVVEPRLVAMSWDGRAIEIPNMSDHEKQRRQFYTKNGKHAIVKIQGVGSNGKAYFMLPLSAAITPANTDGEVVAYLFQLENQMGLQGGILSVFTGVPGFLIIHFLDKGFKRYLVRRGVSFEDWLALLTLQSNGLVQMRRPLDAGDGYYDSLGVFHNPPIRHPQAPPNSNTLLMDLPANACRQTGIERWKGEFYHATEWRRKSTGTRERIDQALLNPVGAGVSGLVTTPQIPKIQILLQAHMGLQHEYGADLSYKFPLPPHIASYSQLGHLTRIKMDRMNFLDPLRVGHPFRRPDLFLRPRRPELNAALFQLGGVRMVNVLNPNETHFPNIPASHMYEFGCSPYLTNKVHSYVTEMQGRISDFLPYLNLALDDQVRGQAPVHVTGWRFEQVQIPAGWNAQEYGAWEPISILAVPGIPARYKSDIQSDHISIIAYVPNNRPLQNPALGFLSPVLQRIKMTLCGPRKDGYCKLGARVSAACVHNHVGAYLAGVLAYNPQAHRSTFRCLHTIDAGTNIRPPGYTLDAIQGLIG